MPATEPAGRGAGVRLRQLLAALVGLLLTAAMVMLGMWQAQVFQSQRSQTTQERAAAPAVDLAGLVSNGSTAPSYGRHVRVTGNYLPGRQVLVGAQPPRRVVSALRTGDGKVLAVVRGTSTGLSAPPPPSGTQTLTGIMLPQEGSDPTATPAGVEPSLRLDQLAQQWPTPLLDGYLTLDPSLQRDPALGVAQAVIPDTSGGRVRNRGYALQWWAFAVFTGAATVVAVRGMGRRDERV